MLISEKQNIRKKNFFFPFLSELRQVFSVKVAGPTLILGGGVRWRGKIGEFAYIRKTEYPQEEFLFPVFVGTPTSPLLLRR
ncbi:hypothetical protein A0128_11035 [Leptospira tipperaryensis]|uniref:Uncharacterized protein n=1 Tax=Leptospira tipperaryensis TaxID=2564040 RepID=A0A1D7UXM9_9LEPT|nr:hypothetical protein A0128_11035 [Leptospira tipperaryensis]